MKATLGQGAKLLQMIADKKVPEEQFQAILSGGFFSDLLDGNVERVDRNEFRQVLGLKSLTLSPSLFPSDSTADPLDDWKAFYRDVFGIELDASRRIAIPAKVKGFDRLLVVAQDMTPERLFRKCKELFPSLKWTAHDLDTIVESDRTAADGTYAVWVRDRIEADEELKSLSANNLKKRSIPGITLEERLVYELKFFRETGRHLDVRSATLCVGSLFRDGRVPFVDWTRSNLRVDWERPGNCYAYLRSRHAVS